MLDKYDDFRDRIHFTEDFIDRAASKRLLNVKRYLVACPNLRSVCRERPGFVRASSGHAIEHAGNVEEAANADQFPDSPNAELTSAEPNSAQPCAHG